MSSDEECPDFLDVTGIAVAVTLLEKHAASADGMLSEMFIAAHLVGCPMVAEVVAPHVPDDQMRSALEVLSSQEGDVVH